MKLHNLISCCALIIPLVWSTAQATDADFDDYVLISYELTAEQEVQFSRTDLKISDFWAVWKEKRLDMVHMIPSVHVTFRPDPEGFVAGDDDVQMDIYSAWGDNGLYFLFEVMDDDFQGYILVSGVEEYHGSVGDRKAEQRNDAIELRLDQYSSEELINNYEQLFPNNEDSTKDNGNSLTMAQYGYRFGGDTPDPEVEIFRRNPSYDPLTADSTSWQSSLEYLWQRWGVDDEAPEKGIHIEVVMGEGNVRYQEWRIAWNQVGMEGSFTKPSTGKQTAAYMGYNDVDAGWATTYEDAMRWRNADSYWNNPKEKGLNAWGDIEYGPRLADAVGAPEIGVLSPMLRRSMIMSKSADVRFTPNGRAVGTARPVRGVVIERTIGRKARRTIR